MQVTDVQLYKPAGDQQGTYIGFANIVLDNAIAIHNIMIVNGQDGPFLSFPSRKTRRHKWVDIVHPINAHARAAIQDAILSRLDELKD